MDKERIVSSATGKRLWRPLRRPVGDHEHGLNRLKRRLNARLLVVREA